MPTERKGYYLTPCGRTTTPRRLMSVNVATREMPDRHSRPGTTHLVFDRIISCWSYRSKDGWSPRQEVVHGDPSAWWDWLEDQSWGTGSISIIAPVASDVFGLTSGPERINRTGAVWEKSTSGRASTAGSITVTDAYSFKTLVLRGQPDILRYTRRGRTYQWVSAINYLSMTEERISKWCGFRWGDISSPDGYLESGHGRWADTARLYLLAMQRLCDWWRQIDGGPWRPTVGGLALSHLRRHLPARSVCTHRHPAVLHLERDAAFGARIQAWFVGDIRSPSVCVSDPADRPPPRGDQWIHGPVYSIDVRSMYPWILATRRFPVKLLAYRRDVNVGSLGDILRTLSCVARVTIETDQPEYPMRTPTRVIYPVGRFTTTLTSPDLRSAIERGHVVSVHECAVYQSGSPFGGAALSLIRGRRAATGADDPVGAELCKTLANAVTGKFHQRSGRWEPCTEVLPPVQEGGCDAVGTRLAHHDGLPERIQWGEWITSRPRPGYPRPRYERSGALGYAMVDPGEREYTRYRVFAGLVTRYDESDVGVGTLSAIYGHITSYGRDYMRRMRECCPPRSVILQDTDGLWVTMEGLKAIGQAGYTWGIAPGELHDKGTIHEALVYGPKHYWRDGVWTLSGYRHPQYRGAGPTFTNAQTINPLHARPTHPSGSIVRRVSTESLLRVPAGGTLRPDGWVEPWVVPAPIADSPS